MTSVVNPTVKRAASLLFLFVLSLWVAGCDSQRSQPLKLAGFTMGTSYHITVVDGLPTQAEGLKQLVEDRLSVLNQQFSTYVDDSELMLLNKAEVGRWIAVSQELFEVLAKSAEISALSDGAFDITMGPLVDLWGFGPTQRGDQVPSEQAIEVVRQQTGFDAIELDASQRAVRKTRAVSLDLSAVAKGYAVDQLGQLLAEQGYQNYMAEIGGEIVTAGLNPRQTPWRIAIEQPGHGYAQVHKAVAISGVAMATSGDYRNYYEVDGRRYSHTIDPQTGYPITHHLASVTVIASDCATADALATAINVMGSERGLQLAQQQRLAIYLIEKTRDGFISKYSDAFAAYLN